MRITPRFMDALWLALGLMAGSAAAQDQAGFVTGSLGDTPLELTVSPDFSDATIIGTYVDTSLFATQIDGGGGPVTLILTFNGELADLAEVMVEIAFAREMGRNWSGDESGLSLKLDKFDAADGVIAVAGTVTGEVTGGPDQETLPVTFSFNARMKEMD
ncbi:hypothetical protein KZZ08_21700 [Roseovarius mucosus]|uniref:hypothetical protein n=2 Tax=Roseovarius TaxID=74030 RepID=UPI001C5E478F|nr:hypothetical protein [Roseovarius mucosus]MBW4976241.1 hypothetical protein [Roseovarius mucosus]